MLHSFQLEIKINPCGSPIRTVKGKQTLHDFFDKIVFLYDNYSKLKFLQEHLLLSFLLLANK